LNRVRAEVPALDVVEVHRAAVAVGAALELAVELRHHGVRVRPARKRVPVGAMRRGEDVTVVQRLADADRDRLLADRDVQEARQLAGAEALLDLLLEAPDQEHLAQELAQALLGERPFSLDLRHGLSVIATSPPAPRPSRGAAKLRLAASSVAPVSSGYDHSLRPCEA